jgi:hypothetical protein
MTPLGGVEGHADAQQIRGFRLRNQIARDEGCRISQSPKLDEVGIKAVSPARA